MWLHLCRLVSKFCIKFRRGYKCIIKGDFTLQTENAFRYGCQFYASYKILRIKHYLTFIDKWCYEIGIYCETKRSFFVRWLHCSKMKITCGFTIFHVYRQFNAMEIFNYFSLASTKKLITASIKICDIFINLVVVWSYMDHAVIYNSLWCWTFLPSYQNLKFWTTVD